MQLQTGLLRQYLQPQMWQARCGRCAALDALTKLQLWQHTQKEQGTYRCVCIHAYNDLCTMRLRGNRWCYVDRSTPCFTRTPLLWSAVCGGAWEHAQQKMLWSECGLWMNGFRFIFVDAKCALHPLRVHWMRPAHAAGEGRSSMGWRFSKRQTKLSHLMECMQTHDPLRCSPTYTGQLTYVPPSVYLKLPQQFGPCRVNPRADFWAELCAWILDLHHLSHLSARSEDFESFMSTDNPQLLQLSSGAVNLQITASSERASLSAALAQQAYHIASADASAASG